MTERNCRLYLLAPGRAERSFADRFAEALGAGDIACVAMRADPAGDGFDNDFAHELIGIAHAGGVPVLIEDDAAAARMLSADGAHIAANDALYADARHMLGAEAIVGAACGQSRHDAMTLAERGADYVAFGGASGRSPRGRRETTLDLVAWWAALVEVPCVAWDLDSVASARAAAEAGADFVALGAPLWNHAQGPAAGVREALSALAQARDAAA